MAGIRTAGIRAKLTLSAVEGASLFSPATCGRVYHSIRLLTYSIVSMISG